MYSNVAVLDPAISELCLPLFEHLPVGIIIYRLEDPAQDESLTLRGCNAAAVKMIRPDLQDLMGRRILDVFPNIRRERIALYAQLAREGGSHAVGETIYGDAAVALSIFDLKATGVGKQCVALFVENLTELKRVKTFLDTIVENLPSMVFVKEARELRFERFNRAGEELLGLKREALLGKNDYDFFPPEQAAFFQERDRATLASGAIVDIPEEPIQTATGQRWLHTRKVPITDATGEPRYLLGISEDITERKQSDQKMRELVAQLEESNAELDGFTYSVSHDLRAPLRAIDGYARVLLEDHADKLDEEGKRVATVITRSAVKMGRLIDDLLAFARLGRKALTMTTVDMTGLARDAADESLERDRKIDVRVAELPPALGDAALLKQVWVNLLSNAVKYTRGRDPAVIEVTGTRKEREVVYTVSDNGVGFDPRYQAKLFGVFQRLHTDTEFEGTGVGLALVQRVVRRHGGWVKAEGVPGKGAAFTFALPTPGQEQP